MTGPQKIQVRLDIESPNKFGVIADQPSYSLDPEAWTNANNMRFRDGSARRMEGHEQIFGTPQVTPSAVFNIPAPNDQSFWFYMSLTKAWVSEAGVHSDVTRVAGDYTTTFGRNWTMALLAGVPVFNNQQDVPQWWPSLSAGQKLENLPNWPATHRARVIRSFGAYLIAMNLTESGTGKPHKVLTSHKAALGSVPSSWDVTDPTKDARAFELTDAEGGELMDGLALGDQFVMYKKNSTHAMRFIGGAALWKPDRLFESSGIMNTRCACNIQKGTKHFVATQDDIITHSGSPTSIQSVVEGKNKSRIFDELDPVNYVNSFCFENAKQNEAWFVYPTTGNVIPNKAYIYEYLKGTATFRDIRALGADQGVIAINTWGTWDSVNSTWDSQTLTWDATGREGIIFASPLDVKLYQLDKGFLHDLATPTCFVERVGLRYNHPKLTYGQRVVIPRVWPRVNGPGRWNVRVGTQEIEDGPITWSNTVVYDPSVDLFVDVYPPANGRLPAIRFESIGNVASRIRGYSLDIAALGEQ